MYFLVDIITILFVLGLTLYGLKAGFYKSTVDVALVLVCIAGAGILAYFTTAFVFLKIGWVYELQSVLIRLIGNSKISGGQPIIEVACYWISIGFFMLISFIVEYFILNILRKLLVKLFSKINGVAFFGVVDKTLGMLVNLAFSAGLVLVVMATFYALAVNGIFAYGDEVFMASETLSYLRAFNPLNKLFASFIKF